MSIDFGFLHQNFSNVIDVGKVVNLKLSFVDSFLANFLVILVSFHQEYEDALAIFFSSNQHACQKETSIFTIFILEVHWIIVQAHLS